MPKYPPMEPVTETLDNTKACPSCVVKGLFLWADMDGVISVECAYGSCRTIYTESTDPDLLAIMPSVIGHLRARHSPRLLERGH